MEKGMSDWMKVVLEEIARKEEEQTQAREEQARRLEPDELRQQGSDSDDPAARR